MDGRQVGAVKVLRHVMVIAFFGTCGCMDRL